MKYKGTRLAYGLLIRDLADYEFFEHYSKDNRHIVHACTMLTLNAMQRKPKESKTTLFSESSKEFHIFLIVSFTLVGCVCCFGIIYEVRRIKSKKVKKVQPRSIKVRNSEFSNE